MLVVTFNSSSKVTAFAIGGEVKYTKSDGTQSFVASHYAEEYYPEKTAGKFAHRSAKLVSVSAQRTRSGARTFSVVLSLRENWPAYLPRSPN